MCKPNWTIFIIICTITLTARNLLSEFYCIFSGHLLIAEVESRFDNVQAFTSDVQRLGFSLKKLDDTHEVFFFMEFTKLRDPPAKKGKLPHLTLKPCIYKKR